MVSFAKDFFSHSDSFKGDFKKCIGFKDLTEFIYSSIWRTKYFDLEIRLCESCGASVSCLHPLSGTVFLNAHYFSSIHWSQRHSLCDAFQSVAFALSQRKGHNDFLQMKALGKVDQQKRMKADNVWITHIYMYI